MSQLKQMLVTLLDERVNAEAVLKALQDNYITTLTFEEAKLLTDRLNALSELPLSRRQLQGPLKIFRKSATGLHLWTDIRQKKPQTLDFLAKRLNAS